MPWILRFFQKTSMDSLEGQLELPVLVALATISKTFFIYSSIAGYMGDLSLLIFTYTSVTASAMIIYRLNWIISLVFDKYSTSRIWHDGAVWCQCQSTLRYYPSPSSPVAFCSHYVNIDCSWRFISQNFSSASLLQSIQFWKWILLLYTLLHFKPILHVFGQLSR